MEWTDFIEHNKLSIIKSWRGYGDNFLLPPGLPSSTKILTVVLGSDINKRSEAFLLMRGYRNNKKVTIEELLNQCARYVEDGAIGPYEVWRETNWDTDLAYGLQAETYFHFCRDLYMSLENVLGEEQMMEFRKRSKPDARNDDRNSAN